MLSLPPPDAARQRPAMYSSVGTLASTAASASETPSRTGLVSLAICELMQPRLPAETSGQTNGRPRPVRLTARVE